MSSRLAAPISLFSEGPRTRTGPSRYDESEYHSLDRSARAYAAEVRAALDGWFYELPGYARPSIRRKFASRETPASAENSLHARRRSIVELCSSSTCTRCSADSSSRSTWTSDAKMRPTGVRTSCSSRMETGRGWKRRVLGADVFTAAERGRVQQLYDLLNRCRDRRFFLLVEIEEAGSATLGRKQILDPIEQWLARLDPAQLRPAIDQGADPPERQLTPADWVITIGATPVRQDMPLTDDERVLGRRSRAPQSSTTSDRCVGPSSARLGTTARWTRPTSSPCSA